MYKNYLLPLINYIIDYLKEWYPSSKINFS